MRSIQCNSVQEWLDRATNHSCEGKSLASSQTDLGIHMRCVSCETDFFLSDVDMKRTIQQLSTHHQMIFNTAMKDSKGLDIIANICSRKNRS